MAQRTWIIEKSNCQEDSNIKMAASVPKLYSSKLKSREQLTKQNSLGKDYVNILANRVGKSQSRKTDENNLKLF